MLQDLRFAARMLAASPGFTAVAVLSLALGIGANSTIFTVVNAVLLHPLPVRDAGTLVSIFTTDERNPNAQFNLLQTSRPNLEDYARQNSVFEAVAVQNGLPLAFAGTGEPEQVVGEIVSGNFFDVLGVTPVQGRGFLPEEDRVPGERLVTVLSHGFWQRRLGGDPAIVGRTVRLNGSAFTVVGVAPPGFKGANTLATPALWVPMMAHPQVVTGFLAENFDSRRALLFGAVGRLRPGVDVAQAEANLRAIAGQLAREYPNDNAGRSVSLLPLAQSTINPGFRRNMVRAGGLLMTVVGLVLLIACANVANLQLARAAAREREVAVRLSLGASRGRLVRQLLTEGLLLAALAGVLGLVLAYWAQGVLWSMRPPALPADAVDLTPGARVLGFTALVSVLTAVVFGLVPAWSASRPDLVAELKQRAGGSARGNRPWSLRNVLVAGQVALSLVALVGAGLFVRSLARTQRIAPGFDHDRLAVLTVDLGAQGYDEPRARDFQRELLERARALPGVERATLASSIPLFQGGVLRTVFTEGSDTSDRRNGRFVQLNVVEPDYLRTMGIPLVRGRDLAETDHADAPRAVVVNETMARQFWPGKEALGQRFQFFGQAVWNEVVGVARDGEIQLHRRGPGAAHLPVAAPGVPARGFAPPPQRLGPRGAARPGAPAGPSDGREPARHQRPHLRGDLRAEPVGGAGRRLPARRVRRPVAGPGRDRGLRRDVLHGQPAHARARRAHGARRRTAGRAPAGGGPGGSARGCGHPGGPGAGPRFHPARGQPAVRSERARPVDVRADPARARCGRGAREPLAGLAGDTGRSHGRAAGGLTGPTPARAARRPARRPCCSGSPGRRG